LDDQKIKLMVEKKEENFFTHFIIGSSLVAISIFGYYLWKRNKTEQETKSEPNQLEKQISPTEAKNKQFLDKYHTFGLKDPNFFHDFLTKNELVQFLILLETKNSNDPEFKNFLEIESRKNIYFSLLVFLQVESDEFAKSETFRKISNFLFENFSKMISLSSSNGYSKMNNFNTLIGLLDFPSQRVGIEKLIVESIESHRIQYYILIIR
jgi:hypothetical protein